MGGQKSIVVSPTVLIRDCLRREFRVADFLPNIPEKYRGLGLDEIVEVKVLHQWEEIEFDAPISALSAWNGESVMDRSGNEFRVLKHWKTEQGIHGVAKRYLF